jgi:HD-GYP domain-containing protein (c-di-GMP phosphodiesterase class II)
MTASSVLAPPAEGDLSRQLREVHALVRSTFAFVDRIALALYDASTDLLKTFASSNADALTLVGHQVELARVPSLAALAAARRERIVDDITREFGAPSKHSAWLRERGYRASYTVPLFDGDELAAFLFFDSKTAATFTPDVAAWLGRLSRVVARQLLARRRLAGGVLGAARVAIGLARARDLETGQHLERMAHYSRLMARALAPRHGLGDEYVEDVFLFAPLHDIGKVGVPDRILHKAGQLDAAEWAVMRGHVEIGERIIDTIANCGGHEDDGAALRTMRNIVAGHHERGDGSGYPRGLSGDAIALEARIVAVADVFDALSCRRPYKLAWAHDAVWREMFAQAAAGQLDADCVDALYRAADERRDIAQRFAEPG